MIRYDTRPLAGIVLRRRVPGIRSRTDLIIVGRVDNARGCRTGSDDNRRVFLARGRVDLGDRCQGARERISAAPGVGVWTGAAGSAGGPGHLVADGGRGRRGRTGRR